MRTHKHTLNNTQTTTNQQTRRTTNTYAVGHMALGYLTGKATAKPFKLNPNIPALMVLSILPDIDILIGQNFHRGPTHSIITATLVFIPFFMAYRQKALPYFFALISHGIADLVIGGNLQLLWPLTSTHVYMPPPFPQILIDSPLNVAAETTIFVIMLAVLAKAKDYKTFFKRKLTNLTLIIPIFTVLLPTFLAYPLEVPTLLIPPHLFFLLLFATAIAILVFSPPKTRTPTNH